MRAPQTRIFFVAALALTFGLAGCASAGGGGGEDGAPRGRPNHIIREELATMEQLDMYQAIQRLRPNWLRARMGQTAQIIVDGNRQPGGLTVLQQYRVTQVQEARFLSASDATTRFGTGFDGGAIMVTTRR